MAAFAKLRERIRELAQKNPAVRYGLVVLLVLVAGYLVATRLFGGGAPPAAVRAPSPSPSASAPSVAAPPRAATPTPAPPAVAQTPKPSVVPSGPTGRPDPFIPLFAAPAPGQTPGALPPPPFPGRLPPPPLPGQQPGEFGAGGIAVTGIVGNGRAVAIVVVGGRTEIMAVGERIGDLRVLRIDSTRRVVTFLQAGRRFDVPMGGE